MLHGTQRKIFGDAKKEHNISIVKYTLLPAIALTFLAILSTYNIISYSGENFDTPFNFTPIVNDTSYFVIVIVISISSILYNRKLNELANKFEAANEELKRKDRVKDEFIRIASHELKSPVQPILGFADLANANMIDQEEAWSGVIKHALRLQKVAKDILDVSRIESGELTYTMKKIRINEVILDVVKGAKTILNGNVSIESNLDKDVEIYADRFRINQVLGNIIDNAVKFTKKGKIKVETHVFSDRNRVEIKISDTGGGIHEDILPNLFGKFVTKNIGGENQNGTGLGLFISKAIVTAHRGEIIAYNNVEGGATFAIILPSTTDHYKMS